MDNLKNIFASLIIGKAIVIVFNVTLQPLRAEQNEFVCLN